MTATIPANRLRAWVRALRSLVDEVMVQCTEDGLFVKCVDPAHVAMMTAHLKKEAFESYEFEGNHFGLDIENLEDHLRGLGDRPVTLEALELQGTALTYQIDPDDNDELMAKLRFRHLDTTGYSDPRVPNLTLPVEYLVKHSVLKASLKLADKFSDHCAFYNVGGEIYLGADLDRTDPNAPNARIHIARTIRREEEDVRSFLPLDYLINMVNSVTGVKYLTCRLGQDYPVEFSGYTDYGLCVDFVMAPRIESD